MSQARHAYRALLRAVKQHVTSSTGNAEFERFAARRFKELARTGGDPALAQDYALLLNSIKEHKVRAFARGPGLGTLGRTPPGQAPAACLPAAGRGAL